MAIQRNQMWNKSNPMRNKNENSNTPATISTSHACVHQGLLHVCRVGPAHQGAAARLTYRPSMRCVSMQLTDIQVF